MREVVDRTILYKKVDSMIPILTEDGFKSNLMAESQVLRKCIISNQLSNHEDLKCFMSLTSRVIDLNIIDLKQLIYDKMEYFGFEAKKIDKKVDMSLNEKIICFCGNFMLFHNESNKEDFFEVFYALKKDV